MPVNIHNTKTHANRGLCCCTYVSESSSAFVMQLISPGHKFTVDDLVTDGEDIDQRLPRNDTEIVLNGSVISCVHVTCKDGSYLFA